MGKKSRRNHNNGTTNKKPVSRESEQITKTPAAENKNDEVNDSKDKEVQKTDGTKDNKDIQNADRVKDNIGIQKKDGAKDNKDVQKTDGVKEHKRFFEIHLVSRQKGNRVTKKKLDQKKVNLTMEIIMVALVALIFFSVFGCIRFIILEKNINEMNRQVNELMSEQERITSEAAREQAELQDKLTILSGQVAVQMVQNEEEATKRIPTALPVSGKVTILSDPSMNQAQEGEITPEPSETMIVVFGVNTDSKVIASGNGTVSEVRYDPKYGNCITIDHGNGYQTLYLFQTEPKVSEGDEVLKGQLLYDVNTNNGKVGYQIIYEGTYLNPEDVMEIKG